MVKGRALGRLRQNQSISENPMDQTFLLPGRLRFAFIAALLACSVAVEAIAASQSPPHSVSATSANPQREAWPSWRRSVQAWHWYNLPDSSLAAAIPRTRVPGNPGTRIGAWNGLAADIRNNRLYTASNGGHADYAGNEVCEIDLSAEHPRWRILLEPTPPEAIRASSVGRNEFHDYYADGRPASTHTYYGLHFLASHNAVFRFGAGSLWGSGNEANWKTDAFSLDRNDWLPAGHFPEIVPDSRKAVIGRSVCLNPATDEVYIAAPQDIRRFDPRGARYETLARWPQNSYAVYSRACAVDTDRNRVVFFGDAYKKPDGGFVFDVASARLEEIRFTGDGASEIVKPEHHFAWYDPERKRFLLKTKRGDELFAIDAETFEVSRVTTHGGEGIPNATNGVHTRWQWLPRLAGFAYYPSYRSGVWFLATE